MAQIVNETAQAEVIASKVSTTPGTYSVTLSAALDNIERIYIGNGTGQATELDPGDSIDVPGDALGKIYLRGTPTGWGITDVVQGTKTFKFLLDQTARIAPGDKITITGSTGNDGIYTVVSVSYTLNKTNVVVSEVIPDATADGNLLHADKVVLFARG